MEAGTTAVRARRGTAAAVAAVLCATALIGIGTGAAIHLLRAHPVTVANAPLLRDGLFGQAVWAPGARPAPAIGPLADQDGHGFTLSALHGRTVALVFFDSHCNQECPLEGRELAAAERSLPARQRPVLLVVSVNPADTPASAARAARAWGLSGVAPWHWLMGSHAALAPVWRAYHEYVGRAANGDIPHTESLVLIDRRGYERSGYLYPFNQSFVTHDLGVLGRERQA
jgi:cytochrome oxidase Cu insertion factor (SCO1/SenC/PrrC family)